MLSLDGSPLSLAELARMNAALRHRGPDDEGFYLMGPAALAMRRLSIIDLDTGAQPIANEDGSVWVVLNGEIYNFRELRAELEARGHRFATRSDTEVIVHLYEEHAEGCVARLRGMFAFAVWDARGRRLLLARDRLGIKPLYYGEAAGRLVFGSELKAVLEAPGVERRLSPRAVDHLLSFLTTPHDQSIVEGVRKLEPGHYLVASPGASARVERYWRPEFHGSEGRSEDDLADELRERLLSCVRAHLVADVPVGAFLSGGIDSSAVVAAMARHASGPVKTFTVGYAESAFSETPHARRVARALGTEHHELILEPQALSLLDEIVWHLDEPFGDSSCIPTYMVSGLAAQHVSVVLSGDGGDEIFGGYDKYVVEERERPFDRLPSLARRGAAALAARLPEGMRGRNLLRHFSLAGAARYLDAQALFTREQKARLLRPELLAALGEHDPLERPLRLLAEGAGHWLSDLQRLDLYSYLPLDILTKVDRMSMGHSIEARVPLLDHELVEFALRVPPHLHLRAGRTKGLFKKALRGMLPEETLARPKQGFAVPLGGWFRGELSGYVRDQLLSGTARRRGVFEPRAVEDLLESSRRRPNDLDLPVWTLLSFELWCRTFLDARRRVELPVASISEAWPVRAYQPARPRPMVS
jgi:asparagine synthase (glutamine-hydrolysing)